MEKDVGDPSSVGLARLPELGEERPPADRSGSLPGAPSLPIGALPCTVRIGVTGHRLLPDDPVIETHVHRAVTLIHDHLSSPSSPVRFVVVSPLAEGADRLVAKAVLWRGDAELEAVLPFPVGRYLEDFATAESRREFEDLLSKASTVTTLPGPYDPPEIAYEQVGRYVVEHCDILIALWDGARARGQGGTAEIVQMARDRQLPLIWVRTEPPLSIVTERLERFVDGTYREINAFNGDWLNRHFVHVSPADVRSAAEPLGRHFEGANLDPATLEPFVAWIVPHYVRADKLAVRYQKFLYWFSDLIFWLAALAVIFVGWQGLFFTYTHWWGALELAALIVVTALFILGTRLRLHSRWINYRLLAEHFRAQLFLAIANGHDGDKGLDQSPSERIYLNYPSNQWVQSALDEVWQRRPFLAEEPSSAAISSFLVNAWIEDQRRYHERAHRRHTGRHHFYHRLSIGLFVAGLGLAFIHVFEPFGAGHTLTKWIILASIGLPALAGAARGIDFQREYERNARRCAQMARQLKGQIDQMQAARDRESVRTVAGQAAYQMLDENRGWFDVMEVHDLDEVV